MEATQKFWKFASTSNATDTLENIFIKWAAKEQITINEFNSIYSAVNEQVSEYFGKTANIRIDSDGSVSGPAEEVLQCIDKPQQQEQNNNIPQESDLNQPIENSPENASSNTAQQPIKNESNVGQESHIGEDINVKSENAKPENAKPENAKPENVEEENIFPLLKIIGS